MKVHVMEIGNVVEIAYEAGTNRSVTSSVKCTNINLEKLRSECFAINQDLERKIELGRNLKIIINKHGFNTHALLENMNEALKTYELYGKKYGYGRNYLYGWQKDLREYLDKQCNRKTIWVVDVEGNDDGKSLFQRNIRDEFGYSRVCTLQLGENVPRAQYLFTEQYKILEKIKDGSAMTPKYNGQNLSFKTPNVLMVFANREPDIEKLSKDRWLILKISEDLTSLKEITGGCSGVNKKKKMADESDDYEPWWVDY